MDAARQFFGAQPDPPRRGPVTRLIRRAARELIALVISLMDLRHRFGSHLLQTEYVLRGECTQRGVCCHHILLEWSPWLDRFPVLGRLVLWKLTRFYDFFDRGYTWEVEDGLMARVLGCHALTADGRCGAHRLRPFFCRAYPQLPMIGKPPLIKGCGYRFQKRGAPEISNEEAREAEQLVQIGRRPFSPTGARTIGGQSLRAP